MLPEMSGHKSFNRTKYMSFLIKDDKFLEKYNTILDRGSNSIKKILIVNLYTKKNI